MKHNLEEIFHSDHYRRITDARIQHLRSLGLPMQEKLVFEMGAGIGDFTQMWVEHICRVTATDMRQENVDMIRRRFAAVRDVQPMTYDVEHGAIPVRSLYDYVFCYGLLYHLYWPQTALSVAACLLNENGMILVETVVEHVPVTTASINYVDEDTEDPRNGSNDRACRPSPKWLWIHMQRMFPHVYAPYTQPDHEEFPLNWDEPPTAGLSRMILIGSKQLLALPTLRETFPETYDRYEHPVSRHPDLSRPAPVVTGS